MKTLLPVQRVAVDQLATVIREHGSALNGSDTGTGKTLMSVELSRDLGLAPLVVCPRSVIPSWRKCFEEQGVEYYAIINYESLRTGGSIFGSWVGAPPKKNKKGKSAPDTRPFKWHPDIEFIIWDEVHRSKSRTSQNGRMLRHAKNSKIKNVLLSATAASNPAEMKSLGFHLGLHKYGDFAKWAREHGCSKDPWGNWQFTSSAKRATEILERLRDAIYPHRGVKVTRADMADFFTNTEVFTDPLDFEDDGKMQEIYEAMEQELAELGEKEALDNPHPAAAVLVATLRARQRVELLKVPLILEMIQEAVVEGFYVAVFLNFNATIQALNEKLGGSVPVVWGTDPENNIQQSDTERANAIEAFQSGRDNVILLNMEAGGVAINLHDEVGDNPRLTLISPTWNEKTLEQVLGRVDRAGAKTDTLQRILYAAGTVEELVRESMARKLKNLHTLHSAAMPPKKTSAPAAPIKEEKPATKKATNKTTKSPDKTTKGEVKEVVDPVLLLEADAEGEPAHAEYGPSSLKHFEVCPSYTNKDSDSNEFADTGTRIHNALETEDIESLEDEEEQKLAQLMLDQVRIHEEEHGVAGGELHREIRLPIHLHHFDTFGTMDRLAMKGRIAVAQDYKCGALMPVDPADINTQAWAYSLGVFQMFPEIEIIYFYFLIPKQNEITFAIFTRDETVEPEEFWAENEWEVSATAADIHLRVNLIISRAKKLKGKEFNPQPHQCEFCGNKLGCEKLIEKFLPIFHAHNKEGLLLPKQLVPSKINNSVDSGRARMMARLIKEWAEEVDKKTNALYRDDQIECPGFTWHTRSSDRRVTDAVAAFNIISEHVPIEITEFMDCLGAVKVTEMEKVIKEHAPQGEKEEILEAVLSDLTEQEILSGGDTTYGYLQIDRKQK